MLLNSLFFVNQITSGDYSIEAEVRIDKNHAIFEGHFPGKPVLPGVCMVQLMKELMEQAEKKHFRIKAAANIKFLAIIDPAEHERIQVSILVEHRTDAELKISASLFAGEVTFFKLKAALQPA